MKQTVQNLHMYKVKYSLYKAIYKAMLHFVTVISCENYSWHMDNRMDMISDQIQELNIQHLESDHTQTLPDCNFLPVCNSHLRNNAVHRTIFKCQTNNTRSYILYFTASRTMPNQSFSPK